MAQLVHKLASTRVTARLSIQDLDGLSNYFNSLEDCPPDLGQKLSQVATVINA